MVIIDSNRECNSQFTIHKERVQSVFKTFNYALITEPPKQIPFDDHQAIPRTSKYKNQESNQRIRMHHAKMRQTSRDYANQKPHFYQLRRRYDLEESSDNSGTGKGNASSVLGGSTGELCWAGIGTSSSGSVVVGRRCRAINNWVNWGSWG
jgi:hypothetical protein